VATNASFTFHITFLPTERTHLGQQRCLNEHSILSSKLQSIDDAFHSIKASQPKEWDKLLLCNTIFWLCQFYSLLVRPLKFNNLNTFPISSKPSQTAL